jgi:hypothetical protein
VGRVYGQTKLAWKQFFEADSERQRDRYAVREAYCQVASWLNPHCAVTRGEGFAPRAASSGHKEKTMAKRGEKRERRSTVLEPDTAGIDDALGENIG